MRTFSLLIASSLLLAGCSKRSSDAVTDNSPPRQIDACTLLTAQEIETVQGEPVRETKTTPQETTGDVVVSKCEFALAAPGNSIVITVTQPAAQGRDLRKRWETETAKLDAPRKVYGVGEDAVWTETAPGGTLHFRQRNCIVRISLPGGGETNTRIDKAESLAELVLPRL